MDEIIQVTIYQTQPGEAANVTSRLWEWIKIQVQSQPNMRSTTVHFDQAGFPPILQNYLNMPTDRSIALAVVECKDDNKRPPQTALVIPIPGGQYFYLLGMKHDFNMLMQALVREQLLTHIETFHHAGWDKNTSGEVARWFASVPPGTVLDSFIVVEESGRQVSLARNQLDARRQSIIAYAAMIAMPALGRKLMGALKTHMDAH